MDPLSIGSAVVGLIAAASRIGPLLHHFITDVKDAPSSASQVLDEMNSVTAVLGQLQAFLIGASRAGVERRNLLSLRNIVATLTACVTTYSELEALVGKCVGDEVKVAPGLKELLEKERDNREDEWKGLRVGREGKQHQREIQRFKWVYYEHEIEKLVARVQDHKLSLTFMLTILQCESMQEAETTMQRLVDLVEGLVASNTDLRIRLDVLAMDHTSALAPAPARHSRGESSSSSMSNFSELLENDLNNSRVYQRSRPGRHSIYSISSSERGSMALSAFSDLSLGNISVISVLCLPVWSTDLSNSSYYRFGHEGLVLTMDELAEKYPFLELPEPLADGNWSILEPQQQEPAPKAESRRDEREEQFLPVLFLAASLFEFNIPRNRKEGGYCYLEYVAGEIFDIVATKGELWLARNQDDPLRTLGWIWEKHFARLLTEDDNVEPAKMLNHFN